MFIMAEPLQLEDYLRIARRRLPIFLATFLTIAVIAVSIVMLLPPIYRSTGTIAIESQQIPADLIRSTVSATADQRIGFINQIVMTDSRLEEIVDKYGLYPEERAVLPMMQVVEKLRENVVVASVVDPYATRATIAFTVSFDHTDPEVARNVAQELTDLFLAENVRTRNARATDTAAFLRRETARLNDDGPLIGPASRRVQARKQRRPSGAFRLTREHATERGVRSTRGAAGDFCNRAGAAILGDPARALNLATARKVGSEPRMKWIPNNAFRP